MQRTDKEIYDVADVMGCPTCGGTGVNCCVEAKRLATIQAASRFTAQDLAMIRRVLLSVIDEQRWEMYAENPLLEEIATENRVEFADEITKRLVKEATPSLHCSACQFTTTDADWFADHIKRIHGSQSMGIQRGK